MIQSASKKFYLSSLAREELARLRSSRAEKTLKVVKPFVPHQPSERQREFLSLDCEEALFGGSTRGGKSDALIMAALQYVDVPGYSAGIFRLADEDYRKPDSILNRAQTWFSETAARWDNTVKGFRFSSGATIHFGTGQNGNIDALRRAYQGVPFQFIGIDELTQWSETAYRFLFSRLVRLKGMPVPIRMRSSSNPDGPGHDWVKERFAEHAIHVGTGEGLKAGLERRQSDGTPLPKPAHYKSPPSVEALEIAKLLGREPQGAYFVPSFVADNPGVDVDEYRVQLAKLDSVSRAQLEHGNWWVFASGGFFKVEHFEGRILETEPEGIFWLRAWDLAGTKPDPKLKNDPCWSAGAKLGIWFYDKNNFDKQRLVIAALEHFREDPGPTQARVRTTAQLDGRILPIVLEQEPGSAGKMVVANFAQELFGYTVVGFPKTGPKEEYWRPVSAMAEAGALYLVRGEWNSKLISQFTQLPHGKKDIADAVATGAAYLLGAGADAARLAMAMQVA